jgi:hypothetical protein
MMWFECTLVFEKPKEVPEDIIKTVFTNVADGKTSGKIGDIYYRVGPEHINEFGCPVERGIIDFCGVD